MSKIYIVAATIQDAYSLASDHGVPSSYVTPITSAELMNEVQYPCVMVAADTFTTPGTMQVISDCIKLLEPGGLFLRASVWDGLKRTYRDKLNYQIKEYPIRRWRGLSDSACNKLLNECLPLIDEYRINIDLKFIVSNNKIEITGNNEFSRQLLILLM